MAKSALDEFFSLQLVQSHDTTEVQDSSVPGLQPAMTLRQFGRFG
jgi:hypothetical protein